MLSEAISMKSPSVHFSSANIRRDETVLMEPFPAFLDMFVELRRFIEDRLYDMLIVVKASYPWRMKRERRSEKKKMSFPHIALNPETH